MAGKTGTQAISQNRPGVVFDCMIYLQATANASGAAAACLRLLDQDLITVFISRDILREITDVLSRPKVRAANPNITDESLAELLRRLVNKAKLVRRVPRSRPLEILTPTTFLQTIRQKTDDE